MDDENQLAETPKKSHNGPVLDDPSGALLKADPKNEGGSEISDL